MIRPKTDRDVKTRPDGFGLDVTITAPQRTHPSDDLPSGSPKQDGDNAPANGFNLPFRNVIPEGAIGSNESLENMRPAAQYVDTVQQYVGEQNDAKLHGPVAALRSADTNAIAFNDYKVFVPRRCAMPRAAQDNLYLAGYGRNVADPRMETSDASAEANMPENKGADRVPLLKGDRDGVVKR